MFPGGFSAGDEPDGSAKFFATVFRNEAMMEEIDKLLHNRGMAWYWVSAMASRH